MSRQVFCQHLNKDADGLDFQLYPGELGKRIFDNISKEAFAAWQKKQTMLINEQKLNMMNPQTESSWKKKWRPFCSKGLSRPSKATSPRRSSVKRLKNARVAVFFSELRN